KYALNLAPSPLACSMAFVALSTTHFASRSMVAASTGPATQCRTRPSGAQKYAATLTRCFCLPTIRKVPTFWKEEQNDSLMYFPTSGLARAFTRSASALFQVKSGFSKLPEMCSTKTSFCSFFACVAASDGVSKNCTLVPWSLVQPQPSVFSAGLVAALTAGGPLPVGGSPPFTSEPGASCKLQPATSARPSPAAARSGTRRTGTSFSIGSSRSRGRYLCCTPRTTQNATKI